MPFALAVAALLIALPVAAPAQEADRGDGDGRDASADAVGYDARPDSVVLRFAEHYGELAGSLDGEGAISSLTVYGNGRAVVHHPRVHRLAGRREASLSPERLRSLLRELLDLGVGALDPTSVRAEMARQRAGRTQLSTTSDPSTIVIEYTFERTRPGRAPEPIAGSLRWVGLRADARAHPELPELQQLDAVRRRLSRTMDEVVRDGSVP